MRKNPIMILGVLAFAVLTTACSQQADIGITTKVKSLLESDRIVSNPAQIQVTTENKVVTLAGPVDSPATKEHAVTVARKVDGVKAVVDNLKVAPGAVAAPVAAMEAQPAPAPVAEAQPAAAPAPVAETKPVAATKPVAETKPVAQTKPAVAPVPVAKAQPSVAPVPIAEVQPAVQPAAPLPIPESQPAVAPAPPAPVAEAKPAGVQEAPATNTAPTDAAITQAVKEKLSQQPETSTANITVDTHEGVVTLSGTVKSMQEKVQVIQIARGTQGVQRVEDRLSVSTS
jgi:osmotically-inducible protein OsmY